MSELLIHRHPEPGYFDSPKRAKLLFAACAIPYIGAGIWIVTALRKWHALSLWSCWLLLVVATLYGMAAIGRKMRQS